MPLSSSQSLFWTHLVLDNGQAHISTKTYLEPNSISRRSLEVNLDEETINNSNRDLIVTVHSAVESLYLSDYSVYLSDESISINSLTEYEYYKTRLEVNEQSNSYPQVTATYNRGNKRYTDINILEQQRDEVEIARVSTEYELPTIDTEGFYKWEGKTLRYNPIEVLLSSEEEKYQYTFRSIPNGVTTVDLLDSSIEKIDRPLLESVYVPSMFSGELPTLKLDNQMEVATQKSIAYGLLLAVEEEDKDKVVQTLLGITNLQNPMNQTFNRLTRRVYDSNVKVEDSSILLWAIGRALVYLQEVGFPYKYHLGAQITSRVKTVIKIMSLQICSFIDQTIGWSFIGLEGGIPLASYSVIGSLWAALALGLSLELVYEDEVYKKSFPLQSSILNSILEFDEENYGAFDDGKDRRVLPLLIYWQLANSSQVDSTLTKYAKGYLISNVVSPDLSFLMVGLLANQLSLDSEQFRLSISNYRNQITLTENVSKTQITVIEESLLKGIEKDTKYVPTRFFNYYIEEVNGLQPLLLEWQHYFWPNGDGWQSTQEDRPVLEGLFLANLEPFLRWEMDYFMFSNFVSLLNSQGEYTEQWGDIAQLPAREFIPNTVWREQIYQYLNRDKNSLKAIAESALFMGFVPVQAFREPKYKFVLSWEEKVTFDYFPVPDLKMRSCEKEFDPKQPSHELYPYIFSQPTFRSLTHNLTMNENVSVLDIVEIERPSPGFTNYLDLSTDISISAPVEITLDGYYYIDLLSNYVGTIYINGNNSSQHLMKTLRESCAAGINLVVNGYTSEVLLSTENKIKLG